MSQPKKQVRTLHERLKIVEEVEKNPGEKCVDIAKRLGLAPSTLNSIFAKKDKIREQTEKCGNASKKMKIVGSRHSPSWKVYSSCGTGRQGRRIFQLMEPFFVERRR
jgi:hypothetical protein